MNPTMPSISAPAAMPAISRPAAQALPQSSATTLPMFGRNEETPKASLKTRVRSHVPNSLTDLKNRLWLSAVKVGNYLQAIDFPFSRP